MEGFITHKVLNAEEQTPDSTTKNIVNFIKHLQAVLNQPLNWFSLESIIIG